jgi:hypothetical protein
MDRLHGDKSAPVLRTGLNVSSRIAHSAQFHTRALLRNEASGANDRDRRFERFSPFRRNSLSKLDMRSASFPANDLASPLL